MHPTGGLTNLKSDVIQPLAKRKVTATSRKVPLKINVSAMAVNQAITTKALIFGFINTTIPATISIIPTISIKASVSKGINSERVGEIYWLLIKSVLKKYPESHFLKVAYSVDYEDQKTVEKTYKIKIMKDGKKRTLKINPVVI